MNESIDRLCKAIETAEGRKMKSPSDFNSLQQHIFEKTHQSISASTLKRVWGYMSGYSSVRPHTLDLLARYIDYRDFEHCLNMSPFYAKEIKRAKKRQKEME